MNPLVRDPLETTARRALEVSGNYAFQPYGPPPQDDSGTAATVSSPQHGDGGSTYPFALDSSPLDDDHYYLM